MQGDVPGLGLVVNGLGLADLDTLQALGADAAGEAALRLGQGLLLAEAQVHLAEVPQSFGQGELRHPHPGPPHDLPPGQLLGNLRIAQFHLGLEGRLDRDQLFALQVADDGAGRLVSCGDGVYHEGRARHHVAASEDAGPVRGHGIGVNHNSAPPRPLHSPVQVAQIGGLADGEDDGVGWQDVLGAGDLVHVRLPIHKASKVHLDAADAGHPAVSDHHLLEGAAGVDGDSLRLGLLDLPGVSGHLGAGFQAGHLHFAGPQAGRDACHVNGHVAPSKHQDPVVQGHPLSHVHPKQEIGVEQDIGVVGAGQRELSPSMGPCGQEDRLVAGFEESVEALHSVVQS